jgi:hypothetical protein
MPTLKSRRPRAQSSATPPGQPDATSQSGSHPAAESPSTRPEPTAEASAAAAEAQQRLQARLAGIRHGLIPPALADALKAQAGAQDRKSRIKDRAQQAHDELVRLLNNPAAGGELDEGSIERAVLRRNAWRDVLELVSVADIPQSLVTEAITNADRAIAQAVALAPKMPVPQYILQRNQFRQLPLAQRDANELLVSIEDKRAEETFRNAAEHAEQWANLVRAWRSDATKIDVVAALESASGLLQQGEELGQMFQLSADNILIADNLRERSGMTWRFEHFDPPEPAQVNIMGDTVKT